MLPCNWADAPRKYLPKNFILMNLPLLTRFDRRFDERVHAQNLRHDKRSSVTCEVATLSNHDAERERLREKEAEKAMMMMMMDEYGASQNAFRRDIKSSMGLLGPRHNALGH